MEFLVPLFMVITGCCAKENLFGTSFVFYKVSTTSRVVLQPAIEKPLSSITVCLQCHTDNIQRDSLFKLEATNESKPLFHLYQTPDYYHISMDDDRVSYKTSKESMRWRFICVSWKSSTGIIHFAVNGDFFPRRVLKPGFAIAPNVTAVLGQDLASVGITLYRGEPTFVGEINNVNMWDHAINPNVMKSLQYSSYILGGKVIDWESVDYEVYGDVVLYKP
ncbi:C-reactive protein-like [Leptodactylus fuscus]|uniref:C-reactive protein-like n=1 Tax=Leptodactylus fuscus TaxID=238119 RepID=UPI003F4EB1E2